MQVVANSGIGVTPLCLPPRGALNPRPTRWNVSKLVRSWAGPVSLFVKTKNAPYFIDLGKKTWIQNVHMDFLKKILLFSKILWSNKMLVDSTNVHYFHKCSDFENCSWIQKISPNQKNVYEFEKYKQIGKMVIIGKCLWFQNWSPIQ